MKSEYINQNNNTEKEDAPLLPVLLRCYHEFVDHWKWFVLSAVVCTGLSYLYQQRQARVYQRQTVMLIEDADPSSSGMTPRPKRGSGTMSSLMELNGISVGDNLKNEIFILTSNRLMERVVDSLHLDIDYTMKQALHEVTLYRNRPFELIFEGPTKVYQKFTARVNADGTVALSDFSIATPEGEKKIDKTVVLHDNEVKDLPVGRAKMQLNRQAMKKFPLEKDITVTRAPKKLAAAIYASEVSASEYDKETSLIVLTCSDVNPDRAEDIVQQVFEAYKQDVVDNKNRLAFSTAKFIDDRIQLIGQDLSNVENQMAEFKRQNKLIDFTANAQAFITDGSQAHKLTLDLETQLAVTKFLADFLQDQSKCTETVPMLSLQGSSLASMIGEYNKTMIERNRMANNSSEASPIVRDADRQLASMRSSLVASVNSYVRSVEMQLAKARENEMRLTGQMGTVPEKEKQGLDIKRQQELKSSLYTYLLNKREEVALQTAINEANVRLVEGPLGSNAPIKPRKSVILLIGLIIGLMIPSAILWLKNLLDVNIHGRRDVEDATTIPIVGEIPHYEGTKEGSEANLISDTNIDAPIVEAFRMLRYSLNFMRHSAKVFIVTSSIPGQGKSFVSTNLAYILGTTGKRVLFIDTDIRKRTVSRAFGNSKGLTALLSDEENVLKLGDVVLPAVMGETVDFLPAGKMPPNPSELLMSDKFDEIIDEARAAYDYVVIDTTPTLAVADAGIANRVADITVFVMRVGAQRRDFLPDLQKMYEAKKFRNLCIAINDADLFKGYGYGYGYGYGFAQEK